MSPPKHSASSPRPGSSRQRLHSGGTPTEKESPLHYEENLSSGPRPSTEQVSGFEPVQQEGPQQQHGTPTEDVAPDQRDVQQPTTPQPTFRPFFTLIKDTNTSQYHYPEVRYIFSDDDNAPLTDASLRSFESQRHDLPEQHAPPSRRKQQSTAAREDGSNTPKERYVVIDMEPVSEPEQDPTTAGTADKSSRAAGDKHPSQQRSQDFRVTSANSLTPSWAVLNARLSPAPAFDTSSNSPPSTQDNQESPVGGLMLKIEGTSGLVTPGTAGGGGAAEGSGATGSRQQGGRRQTVEEMMEQLHRNMDDLRLVVEASSRVSGREETKDEPKDEERGTGGDGEERQEEQQEEHKNE